MGGTEILRIPMKDGARISVSLMGRGEPLLLLHGNGETALSCYKRQLCAFSSRYRLILPDSRGHGASGRGPGRLSLAAIAQDMAALLDHLGLPRVRAVGFSDGANAALLMALSDPARFSSLTLVGANLFPAGLDPRFLVPMSLSFAAMSAAGKVSGRARRKADLLRLMAKEPRIEPARLSALAMPVLVMAGERDLILSRHTRLIRDSLPDARLAVLPGVGHMVLRDAPDEANRRILDFFEKT